MAIVLVQTAIVLLSVIIGFVMGLSVSRHP